MATLAPCSIFDLDVEERPSRALSLPVNSCHQLEAMQQSCSLLSTPAGWRLDLLRDVRTIQAESGGAACTSDRIFDLAADLMNLGYSVSHRVSATGGSGQTCFQHLHNSFLLVWRGPVSSLDDACVVDPVFRSNFELSSTWMTPEYSAALPTSDLFVGTFSVLMKVIQLLCTEMAAAFKSRGVSLPPWRTLNAIRSKWSPVTSRVVETYNSTSNKHVPSPATEVHSTLSHSIAIKTPAQFRHSAAAALPGCLDPAHQSTQPDTTSTRDSPSATRTKAVTSTPWRVQTGFDVSDVSSSSPSTLRSLSASSSSSCSPRQTSLRGLCPTTSAFDMWSHVPHPRKNTRASAAAQKPPSSQAQSISAVDHFSYVTAPIRTVKMCGRTRA